MIPTSMGKKFKIALSLFLKTANNPIIKPIIPKIAIAGVGKGRWKEFAIFIPIKMMKAMLNPTDHLPCVVFGNK